MRDFHLPGRSPVYATGGLAATSMPVATLTALDVLRAGGTAMDAAIAAVAVLGVVEPHSTGLGGDCFCLYAPAGGPVVALNGSGRSPAAATPEALAARGVTGAIDPHSAHAVTVPGAVSAWALLAGTHGRLGLDALLRPAIRLAEEGWPVHARVAFDWAIAVPKLRRDPASARRFLVDGAAPRPGHVFRQPELAATLRAVAARGPAGFYEGPVAADLVATLRARGGLHDEADFAEGAGAAGFVAPLSAPWRGREVVQCPPNGSGLIALMLLGVLEGFAPDPAGPLGALRLHRLIEAARLCYRDRDAFLADPATGAVPVDRLLSAGHLDGLRALVDDARALPELPPAGLAALLPRHRDTVYVAVADREGNVCSFINSLFESFGTGILAEGSGVMLQNRGSGFGLAEGHPNRIAPRKRPMHTIMPGLVLEEGRAALAYGVMGGHFQPMGHALFLTNHVEHGLDIQEALDLPRLFPTGGRVQVERGVPAAAVAALTALGHDCAPVERPHGGGQAILVDRAAGWLMGASDPRKDGCALGY